MVDIEPMLTYDLSQIGIKTIYHILTILYITYIYPIYVILNYNVKTEKGAIKDIATLFMNLTKPTIYKVSKDDLNMTKNIMYMSNHSSISDFFIDPLVTHYNSKYIGLNKMRKIFPFLGLVTMLTKYCIFISGDKKKEQVIADLKKIEELRIGDTYRNLALYPEGMRRPHRPYVSEQLKKGFIYHSFEHNIPIQIIHTTNKDYVIDDEKFKINYNMKLFTHYSPLVDPMKLRKKFEKREKREYTKDDYYNDFYKIWAKIWKKMDKYRIDSYRKHGMSYDEALQKIEDIAESETKKNKIHVIKDEIWGEDVEINKTFIFIRNLLWGIIYYGIYKIVGFVFEMFFKFKKCKGGASDNASMNTIVNTRHDNADKNGFSSILEKIVCFQKMCAPSAPPTSSTPSIPSVPSMSNIVNENVCSPECSPKSKGLGQFLMNLSL
jgi:1-acyl-sn-glycerol-3-phosphate acyltransferase